MDNNLRQLAPLPQSDVFRVDEKGKLIGIMGEISYETEAYFTRKFNATYIVRSATPEMGEEMDRLDRGDYDFMTYTIWEDMGPNTTSGPAISPRSCMIVTRPPIRYSSDSSDSLTAMWETDLHVMIALILLWLLGISVVASLFYRYLGWKKRNLLWMFTRIFFKQQNVEPSHNPAKIIFPILLLSSFILSIIYGSFLNTERATMTLFDKIDSIDAVESKAIVPLRIVDTKCSEFADRKLIARKTEKISYNDLIVASSLEKNKDGAYQCMISGRCALFATSYELNFGIPFACSVAHKSMLDHPIHVSKPIQSILTGIFMNKNVPKRKLDRLTHYIYRFYEMGVLRVGTVDSMDITIKLLLQRPRHECLEKKIESKVSSPEPLDIRFYEKVLLLYLVITLIAIIIRILEFTLTIFK